MKTSVVLVLGVLALLLPATGASAQASCQGIVIDGPAVGPLPVMAGPGYESGDTGQFVVSGQTITVRETYYRTTSGEIWLQLVPGQWVQAYSGYTTGRTHIIMADAFCSAQMPHSIAQ